MIWADFLAHTEGRRDHPAIICGEGRLSYGDLIARIGCVARSLPSASQSCPNRLILAETEPLPLLLKILACWSVGLVPVILRDARMADRVRTLCISSAASQTACDETFQIGPHHPAPGHQGFGPRNEALVICTSGTTQSPKLVALPAESVLINVKKIGSELGFHPGDLVAVSTPLTYMYGLIGGALSALWSGAAIRLFAAMDPPTVLQAAIRREGITVVQGPPSLMRLFMQYWDGTPFASVRLVTMGGEHMDHDLMRQIFDAFPQCRFQKLYGMTEAGPRVCQANLKSKVSHDSSYGAPFSHFEWYVEPVAQDIFPVGSGRLVLRGPTMFLGYISQGGGYQGLEPDGWFRSSDLVRIDPQGGLHFLDRLDRLFKCGGKLTSPQEIETVLLEFEGVTHARCLKEPHPLLGFIPIAEIVTQKSAAITAQTLRNHCKSLLQPHAIPRRFDFKESFSLSPSGKQRLL